MHIDLKKNNKNVEASIGFSRKWDAKEAGREVAETAIKNLKLPPKLVLLYCTFHYKKKDGFNNLLKGFWEVFPRDTPLIGGTVAGFINDYGCFTRGATCMVLTNSMMDVSLAYSRRVRLSPKKSSKKCYNMIKNGMKNSYYKNKVFINMLSGPKIPKLPVFGKMQNIKEKITGDLATYIGPKIFPLLGYGWGKEEDIIECLSKVLPEYYIFGGSAVDSVKMLDNLQFIDNMVLKNSIVGMGISIDNEIWQKSFCGVHETDKSFMITDKTSDNLIIKKINHENAKKVILDILKIDDSQYSDMSSFMYRISNFFPIKFEGNEDYLSGIGGFFGNNIFLGYKAKSNKVKLMSITGREILESVDSIFSGVKSYRFPFVFMSFSAILINTLGSKCYLIKKRLDQHLKGVPYLVICPINENAVIPYSNTYARVYSFNALSILNQEI